MSYKEPVISRDNYLPPKPSDDPNEDLSISGATDSMPVPTEEPEEISTNSEVGESRFGAALSTLPSTGDLLSSLQQIGNWVRKQQNWLLVILPYLIAWWLPLTWCWHLWGNQNSMMSFQPLVPIGVVALLWARRKEYRVQWEELVFLFPVTNSRRRGDLRLTVIGSILLLAAHLVHLDSLAIGALILITFGIVRQIFGRVMMQSLITPLLFLLLMIPPPDTAVSQITSAMQFGTSRGVAFLVHAEKSPSPTSIVLPSVTLDVPESCGGAAVLFPTFALTIWLLMLLRCEVTYSFLLLVAATVIGLLLSVLRVLFMALLGPVYPDMIPFLTNLNPWLFSAAAFLITFLIGNATQFGRGRQLRKTVGKVEPVS